MLPRLFNPEVFQGSLKKKHYFEGWYFKHVTGDLSSSISVIPGISLFEDDPHSFIQIMDGKTGQNNYFRYPAGDFKWEKKRLFLQVGRSVFTEEKLVLDIENDSTKIEGQVNYSRIVRYPKSIFSPGIMGWYSFVPFMECNHGIVSVNHDLSGTISINGKTIDFTNGRGYIEKDWGTSFPEAWIWIQSNCFGESDTSFSFSVAKIPWLGRFFIGTIAFLYLKKKFYLFSTYNGSWISGVNNNANSLEISVRNKKYTLKINIIKNSFADLRAPVAGEMSRRIKESIDSEVFLQLSDNSDNLVFSGTGKNAGLEIEEKIFSYFR
jgi:tocopherol cyclase